MFFYTTVKLFERHLSLNGDFYREMQDYVCTQDSRSAYVMCNLVYNVRQLATICSQFFFVNQGLGVAQIVLRAKKLQDPNGQKNARNTLSYTFI